MSIVSSLTDNTPIPQPREWVRDSFVEFWKNKQPHFASLGINEENISAIAYRVIGGLAAATAGIVLILGACSIAVAGHAVIIPLCILISVFSFWGANKVERAKEMEHLDAIRKETKYLTLKELTRRYGWDEIFGLGILTPDEFADAFSNTMKSLTILRMCAYYEKIVQRLEDCPRPKYVYSIPLLSEFREKWYEETQYLTFEEIIKKYPLDTLKKYNILSNEEWSTLQELKLIYEQAENQKQAAIKAMDDARFPDFQSFRIAVEQAHRKIDQEYEKNPAVKRLKVIDSELGDKQAEIRNRCILQKEQAFSPCTQFLNKCQTSYQRLKIQDRSQYDALYQQYLLSVSQIEKIAQSELLKLNQRYCQEKEQLSVEVNRAQEIREASKVDVQKANPCLNGSRQQTRQASLLPIEERFRKIVIDLNAQYHARRKVFRGF